MPNSGSRLRAAGQDRERALQGMAVVVTRMVKLIIQAVPHGLVLPRQYFVAGQALMKLESVNPLTFKGDVLGNPTGLLARQFAQDVATGWLDEILTIVEAEALLADQARDQCEQNLPPAL